jgi:hypothetical protein
MGSGVSSVDRSHPPCAPFQTQKSVVKISVSVSVKFTVYKLNPCTVYTGKMSAKLGYGTVKKKVNFVNLFQNEGFVSLMHIFRWIRLNFMALCFCGSLVVVLSLSIREVVSVPAASNPKRLK